MRFLITSLFILLSVVLSAQWKLMPVLDVFGDTTDLSTPYVDVLGTYYSSDSSDKSVNVIVFFEDNLIKFKFVGHAYLFDSSGFEFDYSDRNSTNIYFKGSDGIASEAISCSYTNDTEFFSISADCIFTNKMLDGGKFLLKHSNGLEYRFAIPAYDGDRESCYDINNGTSYGEYDGSGNGVFGRKVIYRNHAELASVTASGSGRIYVKVCIDNNGKVTYCEIDKFNTTITNKATLRKALKMIKGYKYEKDKNAPQEECGMIKLFLDVNAFK